MTNKPAVYFVATEFGEVSHGPAVYTKNLWSLFKDNDEFEFHLVVLQSEVKHPRIHVHLSNSIARKGFYQRLESHIKNTVPTHIPNLLLHVNSAHLISPMIADRYETIVQINDTEVCQSQLNLAALKQHGTRRYLALAWRKKRERAIAEIVLKNVCNSNFTKEMVAKCYQLPDDKLTRIYKAVDLDPFLQVQPIGFDGSVFKIIFIGNNWHRKGLAVLIDAVGLIRAKNLPIEIKVEVYGSPAAETKNHFARHAEQKKVSDCFQFNGLLKREDAPKKLREANLLALPSFEEALGLVAIEALAAGVAVVGSKVGGIPEIVNSSELGRLTEPGNASALAGSILSFIDSPGDHQSIKSRKSASLRFGIEPLKLEVSKLYRTLISNA